MKPAPTIILGIFSPIVFISAQQMSSNETVPISRQNVQSISQERLYALENELVDYKRETGTELLEINKKVENLWWNKFLGIFAASAIAGSLIGAFVTWAQLRKTINRKVLERIEKYMESDASAVKTLEQEINSSKWKSLLRKKPILVLNNIHSKDRKSFDIAMQAFDHESRDITSLSETESMDFKEYEIVLLENYSEINKWNFSEENTFKELKDLIDKVICEGAFFFCYSNEILPTSIKNDPKIKDNLNFANGAAQLYSNLMNSLKFLYLKEQYQAK